MFRGRIAVSPDGGLVVYAAVRDGVEKLFLRRIDRSEAVPIPGTEGGRAPFFSPDGGSIGFFGEDALKKIAVDGESPLTLDDEVLDWGGGASWGTDGSIVYAPRSGDMLRFSDAGLYRVPSGGGAPSPLTAPTDEQRHFDPELLPGGRALLYVEDVKTIAGDDDRIFALSLETGNAQFLLEGSAPRVSAGHLVFVRDLDIWAVRFDASRLAIEGDPVRLAGPVFDFYFGAAFDVGDNGMLAFEPVLRERELVWVNREGRATTLTPLQDSYLSPRLSLDGTRLAIGTEENDIWTLDIERGSRTRLTFSGEYSVPAWKPDGSSVVFGGIAGTMSAVAADGSEEPRVLFAGRTPVTGAWTRDGKTLLFHDFASADNRDIKVFTPSESPEPVPLLVTEFTERSVSLLPDGRWLAYVSNESGSDEIYVRAYPDMDRKRSVSTNGGIQPVWSPTGRELFYRETGRMMVVEVTTEPEFTASQPRVLFDDPYAMGFVNNPNYDVSSNGERFVMIREGGGTLRLDVVLDWTVSLGETSN